MSTNANKNNKWEYSVIPTKSTMNQRQQQQQQQPRRLYSTSNDNSNEEKYERHRHIYNDTVHDIIQKYSSLNHNVADDDDDDGDAPDTPVRPGALDDYLNANSAANGVTIKATTAVAAARGGKNHALNATATTASIGSPDKTASTIVCILSSRVFVLCKFNPAFFFFPSLLTPVVQNNILRLFSLCSVCSFCPYSHGVRLQILLQTSLITTKAQTNRSRFVGLRLLPQQHLLHHRHHHHHNDDDKLNRNRQMIIINTILP
jgi:hypothetical protein